MKDWLRRLRQQGKPLFLMTSSHADYAIASMTFILGYCPLFIRNHFSNPGRLLLSFPSLKNIRLLIKLTVSLYKNKHGSKFCHYPLMRHTKIRRFSPILSMHIENGEIVFITKSSSKIICIYCVTVRSKSSGRHKVWGVFIPCRVVVVVVELSPEKR